VKGNEMGRNIGKAFFGFDEKWIQNFAWKFLKEKDFLKH
jgi:hypothetical protein